MKYQILLHNRFLVSLEGFIFLMSLEFIITDVDYNYKFSVITYGRELFNEKWLSYSPGHLGLYQNIMVRNELKFIIMKVRLDVVRNHLRFITQSTYKKNN